MKFILSFLFVLITGCGSSHIKVYENKPESQCVTDPVAPERFIDLDRSWTIDREFSDDSITMIENSFNEWSNATNQIFKPDLKISNTEPRQQYTISLVNPDDQLVLDLEKNYDENTLLAGYFNVDNYIFIVYERENKSVVMHEIGHFLGLQHAIDPVDLMFPFAGLPCVSPQNMQDFCNINSCDSGELLNTYNSCQNMNEF